MKVLYTSLRGRQVESEIDMLEVTNPNVNKIRTGTCSMGVARVDLGPGIPQTVGN